MPFLALLLPILVGQSPLDALGKTPAQILALGPKRWELLYAKERGDATPVIAAGFRTYGDALAWRNNRLLKGKASPLRAHLHTLSRDVEEVGDALAQGGTIRTVFSAVFYRDVEDAFYRVLTHKGGAPRRKTSDVTRAVATLQKEIEGTPDGKARTEARRAMTRIRPDLKLLFADAARLSRRDSDTVLEFCRLAVLSASVQENTQ